MQAVRLSEQQRAKVLEWRRDTCARVQAVQKERERCVAQVPPMWAVILMYLLSVPKESVIKSSRTSRMVS